MSGLQSPHRRLVTVSETLQSSEWILVISFLTIFLSVALLSSIQSYKARSILDTKVVREIEPVFATIGGAVAKPGSISVAPGTSLKEILKKVKPKWNANLREIDWEKKIEGPFNLHIQELTEVLIQVKGSVKENLTLQLPIGSRVCDLKSKVNFTDDADSLVFKSRRRLKDGEIFEVPKKGIE